MLQCGRGGADVPLNGDDLHEGVPLHRGVIHGQQDELIPFAHGRRLFDAGKGRRFFLEVAGGHGDWFDHSQLPYERELNDFMMAIGLAG